MAMAMTGFGGEAGAAAELDAVVADVAAISDVTLRPASPLRPDASVTAGVLVECCGDASPMAKSEVQESGGKARFISYTHLF